MNCPEVNKPLKFRFLITCYGVIKATEVMVHMGALIYCFSVFDLSEYSLLRLSNLISLYMLILNMWAIFMGIVFRVKRKLFCPYECILTLSMLVVYGILIGELVVNKRIKSSDHEEQFSNDTKENEQLNEKLEPIVVSTQSTNDTSFKNNMWDKFSVHEFEDSLVIPVLLLLFQILVHVIHCYQAYPNIDLDESDSYEEEGEQRIQLPLLEPMEQHFDDEREHTCGTEEGKVLIPDTVDTVPETKQKSSSSLLPEAPVHEEPNLAEGESPAATPRASASEPSSDSEGSALTQRKSRGSKSSTPEPPVGEEKAKITYL